MEKKITLVGFSAQELRELVWEHMFLRVGIKDKSRPITGDSLRKMNVILSQHGYTVSLWRKSVLQYRKAGHEVGYVSVETPATQVYGVGL